MTPRDALAQYFRFPAFRPGQEDALQHVLAGRDLLVVMPTGSGKSLIYQLAALLLPGATLVFSPLVALMKDQVDSMTRRGIPATFINSTLDPAEQNYRLHALADGEYKIVLVAPERLRNAAFCAALNRVNLSLLVVDEAHCLSQWGHDFRPDYMHIAEARHGVLTLALTATATTRVQDDIIRLLGLVQAEKLVKGFNRPNLFLEVLPASDVKTKLARVREFLANNEGAGIIYSGTRRGAEEVAAFAREVARRNAQHYHAGLDADTRNRLQDAFLAGDLPLIVATNAFGMGIDRPDVRFVLHYALPGSLEAYYQEAGRAGRDGLPARAALIYSPKDKALHESFIENDSPTERDLCSVHDFLKKHPQTTFEAVEQATGTPQVKTRVAVEQLEQIGALRRDVHDQFGIMRVQAASLSQVALHEVATQIAARRRRAILDYFGDPGSVEATVCCDNDLARAAVAQIPTQRAETDDELAVLTVFETVANIKWGLGKEKLGMLLKGSHSQKVKAYAQNPNFGKLAAWRGADIESLIVQLQNSDYLKQVGSDKPVLVLTPRGEHALKTRSAVQVNTRAPDLAAFAKSRAAYAAGGTIELTAQMIAQGCSPEQIASERGLTIGTVYSHLAQLIGDGRLDVNAVVSADPQRQIRAAIERVGSVQFLAPIKALLPEAIDYGIIRCVANAWTLEQATLSSSPNHPLAQSPSDPVTAFLAHPHPRPLQGQWKAGWALDFHSSFDGDTQNRGTIGELVYRYKYRDERALAGELATRWAKLLEQHPELPEPSVVIPVPPSTAREFDPVTALARRLATELEISALLSVLVKTRATKPQKELTSLAQKQANVAGAFALKGDVRGKHIVLVDDLFDSGATLCEAARVLTRGGAASLVVLTLTKTIHADR